MPQNGRKYLQYTYLAKDLYPEHIKNSFNSIKIQKNAVFKWAKNVKQHFMKEDM